MAFPRRSPTSEELQQYSSYLEAVTGRSPALEPFLVVPFTLVPDLLSRAQLMLRDGEAFVSKSDGLSILTTLLREHLEKALETTALELANHPDERLLPFVRYLRERWRLYSLHTSVLTTHKRRDFDSGQEKEMLTAGDIENVASHFPPCMRFAYERLRSDGHLKYQGRQQLSLFLKGIHVPMAEALKFWRQSFRKTNEEQFQREYAYNIRHNYGQEGKRANYGCPPCTKIIGSTPSSASEAHGCPFSRNFAGGSLSTVLKQWYPTLDDFEVNEIGDLARDNHQQLACTRCMENVTGRTELPTVTVPTDFFFTSRSKAAASPQ